MPSDHRAEDRLRELLRDPRWSLPPWPDAEARVRRAAQRQRLRLTAVVGVAAIVAAVVPLAVLTGGRAAPVTGIHPGSAPSVSLHQHRALTLPAVGAAGFPASIYPVPPVRLNHGLDIPCPGSAGLQRPGRGIRSAALTVVNRLGRSFQSDLRMSDRVYWSQALTNWQGGLSHADEKGGGAVHVLYSGPLESYHQAFGPVDLSQTILAGCGSRTARGTWMIVTGQVDRPAQQGEYLLIDRRGHILLWIAQ